MFLQIENTGKGGVVLGNAEPIETVDHCARDPTF
jgi:hypothetical protein